MLFRNFNIRPIWILIAVFSRVTAFSQTKQIDSLKLVLSNAREDTNKVKTFYRMTEEFWGNLNDSVNLKNAILYTDSAINLSRKLKFFYGEWNGLMNFGDLYLKKHKIPESRKYFNEAIEVAKNKADKSKLAETYLEVGDIYFFYGNDAKQSILNFPLSLEYYFKALKTFEEINNKYRMAFTWIRIGRTYAWQNFFNMGRGNVDEIEKCAENATRLYKECKETTAGDMAGCNFFSGRAQYFRNRYAEALELFFKALEYEKNSADRSLAANDYLNIGRAYRGLGDSSAARSNREFADKMYRKALENLKLSLGILTELKEIGFRSLCYLYIGTIQTNLKQFKEARENLNNSISYINKIDGGSFQEAYQSLAKLDSAEGNYKLALEHYNMHMAYKDSSYNTKSLLESQSYKLQFEFEKKEDSLKQVQLIAETNLKAEKKQKYFYWIGLAMLALLSFFVLLSFRNQKKINRLAAETYAKEKAELELQTLRAQLNPHFIFNCISSIDGLIQNNEKYNATNYLNKFAKLMRNVLEGSKENSIAFSKDIETLKLYLDLEQLRNEDKYTTQLDVPEELMNSDYIVPPLIIQPFVENAIQHGLKNRPGKTGVLKIEISRAEDHIQYIIADNGIGREAAERKGIHEHKSYGVQMSTDRIKLFNNEEFPSVKIKDEIDNGFATGTTVTVKLKFK